jgi:hypothetical protein
MKGKASETIFDGETVIIPMADVHHIEKDLRPDYKGAIFVIMNGTKWSKEMDDWENPIYLLKKYAYKFLSSYCYYRHEIDEPREIQPEKLL